MAYSNGVQQALDRLAATQESDFDDPLYIEKFPETLADVATVVTAIGEKAERADEAAEQASNAATNGLRATSTTSLSITSSGTRTFSIAQDLADVPFVEGMYIEAVYADDVGIRMWGYIDTGGLVSGTPDQIVMVVEGSLGSGTHAEWSLFAEGRPGPIGMPDKDDYTVIASLQDADHVTVFDASDADAPRIVTFATLKQAILDDALPLILALGG